MRNQRLLIRPLVLVALALAVLLAVAVGLVYFTLDAPGRAQFARLLAPRAALLVLAWALGVVAAMAALQRWWVPRVSALPELAEQTRALVNASAPLQLKARAQADQQPLADAVNALAAQRDALRADVAAEVALATPLCRPWGGSCEGRRAGAAVIRQSAGSVTKPILRTPARWAADIACATRS